MNTGDCTSCYPAYSLLQGKCEVEKPADPNCKTLDAGQCIECVPGFYLNQGKCNTVNPLCRTSNPLGNCLTCYQGYNLSNGNCTIPSNNDPKCIQKSGDICQACADRFYLEKGVCTPVNQSCQLYSMVGGQCITCQDGYRLDRVQCILSPKSSDVYCDEVDANSKCIRCRSRFYIRNDRCEPVSNLC